MFSCRRNIIFFGKKILFQLESYHQKEHPSEIELLPMENLLTHKKNTCSGQNKRPAIL